MKPVLRYLVFLGVLFSCQSIFFAQETQPPAFERYPADVWAGKPAPLNLRSHRLARMFRTRIREQLREEGINFAGHYTVAVMGCGTGCSITAIVDARNGRAYFPRMFDGWTSEIGDYSFAEGEDIRTFKTDSRLMKVIGRPRLGADERWGASGVYYYEWRNDQLRQVHFTPAGSYPGADRP
jgi:hypothetical protein